MSMTAPSSIRSIRLLCCSVATAMVVLAIAPSAARADWQSEFEAGKSALAAKDYRNAETHLLNALNESESFGKTDSRHIRSLVVMAELYRKTRQWAAAAPLLEQAMDAHKEAGTDKSPEAGNILNKVGILYHRMGKLPQAEKAYEASLAIKKRRYRQNKVSIAVVTTNLAELYRRRKDWAAAKKLLHGAVRDKERELGPEHPSLVSSLVDLSLVHMNMGLYAEANPLIERAIAIAQKHAKDGKDEHLAAALHNKGMVLAAQMKLKEAKRAYERALRMRETVLGAKHPAVANTLNNLANVVAQMGDNEAAVPLFQRCISIREFEYGKQDKRVAKAMRNYVMVLDKLGRDEEAKAVRARIKSIEK